MKKAILYISIFCSSFIAFSQDDLQFFISLNGNLYMPINSQRLTYPILGYDKDADPKVLVGGFGVGFSAVKEWKERLLIKGQANFSRHAYWDEPLEVKDVNNNPLGMYIGKSVDYVLGTTATIQFRPSEKIGLGAGLGGDFMLLSVYDFSGFAGADAQKTRNKNYKFFTPVLPLEVSFYLNKILINIRYEQGLVNRYKKPLADYEKENYGLLVFEFGYRLR